MNAEPTEQRKKTRIFTWRGIMSERPRSIRILTAVVLLLAGTSLTFTQSGFISLQLPDGTIGYMVVLLFVVAVGSLTIGTLPGTCLGFLVGFILDLHARLLPLDHYELQFINELTSIVMFGVTGFILGIAFAFALRNNPGQPKRSIYIALICIVVTFLYSVGFAFNALMSLAMEASFYGESISRGYLQDIVSSGLVQFGNMEVQALGTGIGMAIVCLVGDFLFSHFQKHEGDMGLRAMFGTRLAVVVVVLFLAMTAVTYTVTAVRALAEEQSRLISETSYLANQLCYIDDRYNIFREAARIAGFDFDEVAEGYTEQREEDYEQESEDSGEEGDNVFFTDEEALLQGYNSEEDGIMIILDGTTVSAANDPRIKANEDIEDLFLDDITDAIEDCYETGEMQRFVFCDPDEVRQLKQRDGSAVASISTKSTLAYLYATKTYPEGIAEGEKGFENGTVVMVRPSDQVFGNQVELVGWMTTSNLITMFFVFLTLFFMLNQLVARRIDQTNEALSRVTQGDLDARVEVANPREFKSLSDGINETVDTMKGWIAEAESRMDAELATARAIQEAALPRIFPPFPDIPKFDIYASMNAAKEVGGDFYDFFLLDETCDSKNGKLGFVVADVSGKGVPAALFMMKAKALLHDYMTSGIELGEAVAEANRQLVDGNDAGMFVTAWVGVLDYGTGHVDYVNAGHNPPLLWTRSNGWQWMREKSGPMLGLFERPYAAHSIDCTPGDTFLLYTDGVTEAFDTEENLYGEERLINLADEHYLSHPRELLYTVRNDIAEYATGAVQSDDITILCLEVGVPPEITATLEVPAKLEALGVVNDFLHAELDRHLCPQRVQNQLDIAVEEIFVNVCHYAYPDKTADNPGYVRIQHTYKAEPASITVDIIDSGVAFDPLAKPDAVTPDDIEDVPIGGLGILMAKKCTDEMYYERLDSNNVLTLVKKW